MDRVTVLSEFMSIPSCGSISQIRGAFIIVKNHGGAFGESPNRIEVEGLTGAFQRLTPGGDWWTSEVKAPLGRLSFNLFLFRVEI